MHHRNAIPKPAARDFANTVPYPAAHRDSSILATGTINRWIAPGNANCYNCRAVSTQIMKTLHTISFFLFLLSNSLSGQVKGTITDKTTGQPIQFANVFLKDKPIGATTDLNGNFEIKSIPADYILIVSAIGYESRQFNASTETIKIQLAPKTYELSGIIVKPQRNKARLTIETYNKNKIHNYFGCGGYPWIVAKYFEYKPEYYSTPRLNQIKILTSASSAETVIFNFRLLTVQEDGSPGRDLLDKNLIVKAQSGVNKNTIIDLSSYNLTFPQTGFMIAVEWLIIDQNKFDWKGSVQYLPQFGTVIKEGECKTWNYVGGKWFRTTLMPPTEKNKYKVLAAELTLTN